MLTILMLSHISWNSTTDQWRTSLVFTDKEAYRYKYSYRKVQLQMQFCSGRPLIETKDFIQNFLILISHRPVCSHTAVVHRCGHKGAQCYTESLPDTVGTGALYCLALSIGTLTVEAELRILKL